MIIKDKGKVICKYDKNEPSSVPIEPAIELYVAKRRGMHDNEKHHDLRNASTKYTYRINHIDLNTAKFDDYKVFSS